MSITKWLFKPIDQTAYGLFRFSLYAIFSWYYTTFNTHYFSYHTWFSDSMIQFYSPVSFFKFLDLETLKAIGSFDCFLIFKISCIAAGLGFMFPVSSIIAFLSFAFAAGVPLNFGKIHHVNHLPVATLGIMALSFTAGRFSLDAFIKRVLSLKSTAATKWGIQTVRIYMTLIYFASGYQKLKNSGLAWAFSDNLQNIIISRPTVTPLGLWVAQFPYICIAMAVITLLADLTAPLALISKRYRLIVIPTLFFFHIGTYKVLGNHGHFLTYNLCYLVWLPWEAMYRTSRSFLLTLAGKFFDRFPALSKATGKFHLKITIPLVEKYLIKDLKNACLLVTRHSIHKSHFNPLVSDIDFTLVLKFADEKILDTLIKRCVRLNNITKVIDLPQIYLEEEWLALQSANESHAKELDFFWNFRKYSWLKRNPLVCRYENYKKNRALDILLPEVFSHVSGKTFSFSHLKMDFPVIEGENVCVYSSYLELTDAEKVLVCSDKEFQFLISILPGEKPRIELNQRWNEFKNRLWVHEYLLSRSHYRLYSRINKEFDRDQFESFLRFLETGYREVYGNNIVAEGRHKDLAGRVK